MVLSVVVVVAGGKPVIGGSDGSGVVGVGGDGDDNLATCH